MIRLTDLVLLSAVVAGAVWTYQIKHEADLSAKRIKSLNAQILAQDRKIALLEADWALEINPERLEKIASQFDDQLNLKPLESSQIIEISELPGFRVDRDARDVETLAGQDGDVITGGIGELIEREADQ